MEKYISGSFLRNILLKKEEKQEEIILVGEDSLEFVNRKKFKRVYNDYPIYHSKSTTYYIARKIIKEKFTIKNASLKDELSRRDLTINAIAMDEAGNIIDHFGGVKDMKNKILRHVNKKTFTNDPVRILRIARMTAEFPDFEIHPSTKRLIKANRGNYFNMSFQKAFIQMEKLYNTPAPSNYFKTLLNLNVLEIFHPEIYQLTNTNRSNIDRESEGTTFEHTMLIIEEMYRSNIKKHKSLFFACLYHDIGKLGELNPKKDTHDTEDSVNFGMSQIKLLYNISNDLFNTIKASALFHHLLKSTNIESEEKILTMIESNIFPKDFEGIRDLIAIAVFDSDGRIIYKDGSIFYGKDLFKTSNFLRVDSYLTLIKKFKNLDIDFNIFNDMKSAEKKKYIYDMKLSIIKNYIKRYRE